MSKKSRKQRLRKRERLVTQKDSSELMLKKLKNYSIRKDAIDYLEAWTKKMQSSKPIAQDSKKIKKKSGTTEEKSEEDANTGEWKF